MIEVKDLYKEFGLLQVMKGLNLKVKQGETLVVLGKSGVGKSVLLKHILGLTKPDSGYVLVDGINITNIRGPKLYKAISHMGMLFQGAALFDSMNIEENTAFHLKSHGNPETGKRYSRYEIKERVAEALAMVGLGGTQDKMPSDLSGGMKKRAGLARLIVYRPKYLLYDEPTTGLDPVTAMQINELIVKTQKELKATSIVVTHDIVSALVVGDRLALVEDGKVVHIDVPEVFIEIDHPTIKALKQIVSGDPSEFRRKKYE
ncbi:MAG: ATP-binding cassette domain-containing protein [Simkaniaceae bacterium]|nr:ATP-binding cassette domain-containing protein [Simkaniaceae bacterium]MCF7851754.1 ATP-binding cassette domain-containing protein [Simkaniaceae bacterium]